jgi:hypothetical protein
VSSFYERGEEYRVAQQHGISLLAVELLKENLVERS